MSASLSTPRIRLTQLLYLGVLAAVVATDGRALEGGAGLAAQAAGFLLVGTAVLGRIWTTLFIAGRKDEQLVRDGPYARCRHPLYLCSVVAALGIGLTTRSVVLTGVLPSLVAALAASAAWREERVLRQVHGQEWLSYRNAVPAIWPARPTPVTSDRVVVVVVPVYRKAFLDAASFLVLWLLVLLLDSLRSGGAWQALFRLP